MPVDVSAARLNGSLFDTLAISPATVASLSLFLRSGISAKTCTSLGSSCSDIAFVKLSADGSRVLFGSYLGGSGEDNTRTMRYHKN